MTPEHFVGFAILSVIFTLLYSMFATFIITHPKINDMVGVIIIISPFMALGIYFITI